jgi:hypothetical protein
MLALSDMRSRLRIYLNDKDKKLWPGDEDLDLFLNQAIIQFTTDVPKASRKVYTVVTDQQDDANTYLLPTDLVKARFARGTFGDSDTETVTRINMRQGAWDAGYEPKGFLIDWPLEGSFYFPRQPTSDTFTLYYGAVHSTRLVDNADTFDLGRNLWGEQAIYFYAAFLCFNPSSSRRAQLEQWARKTDQNVGNPLEEEGKRWHNLYKELINDNADLPAVWEFAEQETM